MEARVFPLSLRLREREGSKNRNDFSVYVMFFCLFSGFVSSHGGFCSSFSVLIFPFLRVILMQGMGLVVGDE